MDPAEMGFIRKAFKESGAEVLRKIRPSPILWEPFKVSAPPRTAVGDSGTNFQHGNSLSGSVIVLAAMDLKAFLHSFQKRGELIAPLPILRSIHSAVAYRENQHSGY